MSEYGYRYTDPDIGVFFSRLAPRELEQEDTVRGESVAAAMRAWRRHDSYREFLDTYRPGRAPFEHEFRVHCFSRDHHLGILWPKRHDRPMRTDLPAVEQAEHVTIACMENRILARYFSNTLAHSNYRIRASQVQALEAALPPDPGFVSRVSRGLITWTSELGLRVTILACLALVAAAEVALEMLVHRRSPE
jgi:hypothetical protein